ncbi:hypothetical protein LK533_07950 [Sphingomonas sp. PL-96]|uniref:hypothetical protein n=1 Tax=Sphingomonas sp. PL-96 TaxID=2887201 RepID=UPI001E3759D3|nr:hypothetical protein [Sphingomonas sp. PL-96]MCC2976607.1 hypothetical protein [Sphingomonas sp. PL-96]
MISLRHQWHRVTGQPFPLATVPALEPIYRDLFLRELRRLGEEDRFFPVGGAANYSLLYLILRIGVEFRPRSVLDIGAGESTLLWSMLHRRGLVGEVLTLEDDAGWGERIGAQVDHPILVTPLQQRSIAGRTVLTYDWDAAFHEHVFDVVVCDGPRGVPRHSRAGILSALEGDRLGKDFALILDDAERIGEQDTITAIHARLQAQGRSYVAGTVQAAKTQVLFATGRYEPVTFL